MSGLKTYYFEFESEVTEELFEDLKSGLPHFLIERAKAKKQPQIIANNLKAWQLLKEHLIGINKVQLMDTIQFEPKGKPFFAKNELHFNISNAKNIVVLAVSENRVGVDFELTRTPKKNIYSRVFSESEIKVLENCEDEATMFTNLWTKKEAVVKLFGGGISMGLKNFSVLKDELIAFEEEVTISALSTPKGISHIAEFKKV